MSKHHHSQEDIYTSQVVQALEQKYCSSCSAAVVSSCLVSSHGLGARVVSRIYDGGRKAVYTAAVAAMMVQNLTPDALAASMNVSGEGASVSGLTIPGSGYDLLKVWSGGSTIGTKLSAGGSEYVSSGGLASGTQISEGGLQKVYYGGTVRNTVISEGGTQTLFGNATSSAGGVAIGTIISGGTQNITSYAVASNTQIVTGTQNISKYAVASDTTISAGGTQNVASLGSAFNTVIEAGGSQIVSKGGTVISTTLNSGAYQSMAGATANVLIINEGASQKVSGTSAASGILTSVVINGGIQTVARATVTSTQILSGGSQILNANTTVESTIIETGGYQQVGNNATANSTTVGGVQSFFANATISDTVIVSGGRQEGRGTVTNTIIQSGGEQKLSSGASATGTQILEGGSQTVLTNASAQNNTIETGGTQIVRGTVISTTVNSGGTQTIYHNASSIDVIQMSGGNINTRLSGGATTIVTGTNQNGETLSISNGVASNFIVNAGGYQYISAGGSAVNTLLNSGEMSLEGGGVTDTLTAQGGIINLESGAGQLVGNTVLSGTAVNYTRYTSSRNTLSAENLSANGAVFNMNVDLENQEGDKLTVQSSYSGNAQISLSNIASSAQETSEDGIKLVEFSEPSNANGTFSLVGGLYEEGAYAYELAQGTKAGEGKDYYLRTTDYADIFKTMLNVPVMNVMVAQTGMNSLQRRLGDLQNMDNTGKKHGVWVRSYYRDITVDDLAKTDMRLFGAEAGYDWLFRADEPTKLYAGVLIGYVNLNSLETQKRNGAYEKGDGETPSAGVYATLVNEDGWFVDIAARNFWTKLDLTRHDGGPEETYTPKRNVVAVSGELGKNFIQTLSRDKFIRIEPKAEVGWMNAASGKTTVQNGVGELHYQETNYLNGKAGVLLSYNTKYGKDLLIEPLVEVAYRYEFDGKGNVSYGGATEQSDMGGGSLEVNAGLNMQLTDNLYWYALGSYENGRKIEGWGVYAGIRYKFGRESTTEKISTAQQKEKIVQPQEPAWNPLQAPMDEVLPQAEKLAAASAVEVKQIEPLKVEHINDLQQIDQTLKPKEIFHVLFGFNQFLLSDSAKEDVSDFAKAYVDTADSRIILLEAYTCNLGSEEANKAMALGRVTEVYDLLVDKGVAPHKIVARSYGAAASAAKKNFKNRKDYRRVVLSVYDK